MEKVNPLFLEHLKYVRISIAINLILVELGARSACFIQDPYDMNINEEDVMEERKNSFTKEELKNLKRIFNSEDDDELMKYFYPPSDIIKKYFAESNILKDERIHIFMKKYYPKFHIYKLWNGSIISKNPLSKYKVNKAEKDEKYLGKLIDYVCYKNYENWDYKKVFSLMTVFKNNVFKDTPITLYSNKIRIFGNTFCTESDGLKFESLKRKYKKALKSNKSIIKNIVDDVVIDTHY